MNPFRFFLLGLTLVIFASCDPGQNLIIENKTEKLAHVMIVFNKNTQHDMFGEGLDSDTLILALDPTNDTQRREYFFGMGTWKIQSSLDELIAMVNRIEIVTWKSKQIYQEEEQIRDFFESRITGNKKELIEIVLE